MILDQTPTNRPRGQGERMGEGERVVEKHECRFKLEGDKRHVFSAWEEESSERRGGRSRIGFIQRASYPSAQELTTGEKKKP